MDARKQVHGWVQHWIHLKQIWLKPSPKPPLGKCNPPMNRIRVPWDWKRLVSGLVKQRECSGGAARTTFSRSHDTPFSSSTSLQGVRTWGPGPQHTLNFWPLYSHPQNWIPPSCALSPPPQHVPFPTYIFPHNQTQLGGTSAQSAMECVGREVPTCKLTPLLWFTPSPQTPKPTSMGSITFYT